MSKRNIVITAFVAVGLVTSLGYASIAQSPTPTTSPSPQVSPTPTTSSSPQVSPTPTTSPSPQVSPTPTTSPSPQVSPTPTTSPSPQVSPTPTTSPSPQVSPTPTTSPSPQVSPTPTTSPTTSPTNRGNQSSLSQTDRQFMVQAAQGGMAEVQFGQIATKRASSNTVRQYAQRMIQEHTKANNELMALAKAKGVTLPKTIGTKNEELRKRLSTLSGTRFDREYMREAGVRSHTEQAKLFERQIQQGQDPDVIAFATKTLPVVREHLQRAEQITGTRSRSSNSIR